MKEKKARCYKISEYACDILSIQPLLIKPWNRCTETEQKTIAQEIRNGSRFQGRRRQGIGARRLRSRNLRLIRGTIIWITSMSVQQICKGRTDLALINVVFTRAEVGWCIVIWPDFAHRRGFVPRPKITTCVGKGKGKWINCTLFLKKKKKGSIHVRNRLTKEEQEKGGVR